MNQPRDPLGRFTTYAHSDPGVSLASQGSFAYPPRFTTAKDVMAFWSEVQVPDGALARCEKTYLEARKWAAEEDRGVIFCANHLLVDWRLENPPPDESDEVAYQEWDAKAGEQFRANQEIARGLIDRLPDKLPREDMRAVVRALGAYKAALDLRFDSNHSKADAEGYVAIANTPLVVDDDEFTVREFVTLTGLFRDWAREQIMDGAPSEPDPNDDLVITIYSLADSIGSRIDYLENRIQDVNNKVTEEVGGLSEKVDEQGRELANEILSARDGLGNDNLLLADLIAPPKRWWQR